MNSAIYYTLCRVNIAQGVRVLIKDRKFLHDTRNVQTWKKSNEECQRRRSVTDEGTWALRLITNLRT